MSTTSIEASEDTYLRDGAHANNNFDEADGTVRSKATSSSGFNRVGLFKFDLSSIPATATVSSVVLDVTIGWGANGSGTSGLFECLVNWPENDTTWTWIDSSEATTWDTGGCRGSGDMNGEWQTGSGELSSVSYVTSDGLGDSKTFGSSSEFVSWASGTIAATGTGILVMHQRATQDINFGVSESENSIASSRPTLTVTWTTEAAGGVTVGQMTPTNFWGGIEI